MTMLRRFFPVILACCLVLTAGAGLALEDITVTTASINETTDDLIVSYEYPVFNTENSDLYAALTQEITQHSLTLYDELTREYETFAAERTDEQKALFESDATYRDEISSSFSVLSQGDMLQIVTTRSYWPAGGNGNWEKTYAYCFSTKDMRLLTAADFYDAPEADVYAALNAAVSDAIKTLEYAYDDAAAEITADVPFYYDGENDALCFMFDPYVLSAEVAVLSIPIDSIDLTRNAYVVTIVNPMREVDENEIAGDTGITVKAPDGSTDVGYFMYDMPGEAALSEMGFTLNGTTYTLRFQATAELIDISGMYFDFTFEEAVQISGHDGELLYNEGAEGICLWYDADAGVTYSMSVETGATAEGLTVMAETMYASLQTST